MTNFSEVIATELGITLLQVENTLKLLLGGASIPFIARYRKEATGCLDELKIILIRNRYTKLVELEKRKEAVTESIREQEKLTPELEQLIQNVKTLSELEDIYLPFKQKRKTRAMVAVLKGLEPLAKIIISQREPELYKVADTFIKPSLGVNSTEDALQGARDILAEWISENTELRKQLRKLFEREAIITSKVVKGKEKEAEKYRNYFDCSEPLYKSPSHRILAMFRGENEGLLKVKVLPLTDSALSILKRQFIKAKNQCASEVDKAIEDSYKRLLAPSMENEIRGVAKERADRDAIEVFAENLRQLLMASPLGEKNVLAIDPGFKSGCKLVCLDKQGKLLHNETIYPHPPENQVKQAVNKILSLVNAYKIEAIAIGNGTASRETERFIKSIRFEKELIALVVNESGASVYSASSIAREEFPEYDVTVRGAVSIGRRLMDPLAELVKIDPKSIGVGQYQHDVNQTELQKSLDDVVLSCVNSVGVEINTASKQLLTYLSGVGTGLAQNIIDYRNKIGAFKTKEDLKKVTRFGEKAFEQAAGFIRISNAENYLDRSAVHPESYQIVYRMAESIGCSIEDIVKLKEIRDKINLAEYVTDTIGLPTLNDIIEELSKPGRDPRKKFEFFEFDKSIHSIKDLKQGMILPGIITNITVFGAFVDIGVHQDGLVHVSQMANAYVKDPNQVVKINQKVKVKVLDIDIDRKRITLSMKEL